MIFVDTNCFLRFLLEGEDDQHKKTVEFFKTASLGEIQLFTSSIVFFEIYWVLSTFYQKKGEQVKNILSDILKMNFIKIKERKIIQKAVLWLDEFNYDLEDSYNCVYALVYKAEKIQTFDRNLDKKFNLKKTKID
jgi:predicted nucleic-acid-binding protein